LQLVGHPRRKHLGGRGVLLLLPLSGFRRRRGSLSAKQRGGCWQSWSSKMRFVAWHRDAPLASELRFPADAAARLQTLMSATRLREESMKSAEGAILLVPAQSSLDWRDSFSIRLGQ